MGLLGLSNFHLLAAAVALRRSENTHWILARRVSNEIVVMRALCCELKLVKVIQSSAARYVQACVFVNVRGKTEGKESECMFACVGQCMWSRGICIYVREDGESERKGETKILVFHSSESI